jgi:hypothetical protein
VGVQGRVWVGILIEWLAGCFDSWGTASIESNRIESNQVGQVGDRSTRWDETVSIDINPSSIGRLICLAVSRQGKAHFINMTLGNPVLRNNPDYDPTEEGKRRAELPPTVRCSYVWLYTCCLVSCDDQRIASRPAIRTVECARTPCAPASPLSNKPQPIPSHTAKHTHTHPHIPPKKTPKDDVPELVRRALAELEHAMRPTVRPGGRAIDVSLAAKALQDGITKARAATTPKTKQGAANAIPSSEKGAVGDSCCSSSKAKAAGAAPTGAGVRQRQGHHRHHHKSHGHSHKHGEQEGGCCSSSQEGSKPSLAAPLAAAVAWAKAAVSGPEEVKEHMHMPGGGCCGGGVVGPSRMGAKQDGHAFMVGVLILVLALPFVLWMMS